MYGALSVNPKSADKFSICQTRLLPVIFTALYFFFSFSLANAQATVDTMFLDASVNADGSIDRSEDSSLTYQSTAESIITYQALGLSDAEAAIRGRTYLQTATINSTENIALRLLASPLNGATLNAALVKINKRQNRDGGVGAFAGFDSELISSAFALRALSRASVTNEITNRIVSF